MKRVIVLDENGFYLRDALVKDKYPDYYTEIVPPTHEQGFFRAKWTGIEWIEGATQEEIDELTKTEPSSPTTEQRIAELESVVNLIILGGL